MSALATPQVVHHACGHTHRYVLHAGAAREAHRLEGEPCPACARTSHSRRHHPDVVDSGLGLQPSGAGDPNNFV